MVICVKNKEKQRENPIQKAYEKVFESKEGDK